MKPSVYDVLVEDIRERQETGLLLGRRDDAISETYRSVFEALVQLRWIMLKGDDEWRDNDDHLKKNDTYEFMPPAD